jgi:hypothetical protein
VNSNTANEDIVAQLDNARQTFAGIRWSSKQTADGSFFSRKAEIKSIVDSLVLAG